VFAAEQVVSHSTIYQAKQLKTENEKGVIHPAAHPEHASQEQENPSDHFADDHHSPPPSIYYLYWMFLGLTFVIVCFYCLWVYKKGKPEHEGLSLSIILVSLVIILYAMNQFPELQRHFDSASRQFVNGYYESTTAGFVKFIYKIMLGILLMIYGLMGKKQH